MKSKIRTLPSGRELTVFSTATDIGYFDKEQGAWSMNLRWHHCFTYQHGLVQVLKERSRKGAHAIVVGHVEYPCWRRDGETAGRTKVEIMIGFNGTVNFVNHDRAADALNLSQVELNRPY